MEKLTIKSIKNKTKKGKSQKSKCQLSKIISNKFSDLNKLKKTTKFKEFQKLIKILKPFIEDTFIELMELEEELQKKNGCYLNEKIKCEILRKKKELKNFSNLKYLRKFKKDLDKINNVFDTSFNYSNKKKCPKKELHLFSTKELSNKNEWDKEAQKKRNFQLSRI